MSVTVQIPTPLRRFTDDRAEVELEGTTVGAVLNALIQRYGSLERHLYQDGKLRSFVNIFLGDEDVRHLDGEATPVADGDTLTIIPAIAGGGPE
ncbi:MAG: MoaD/ThiS family protein [Acidobacteriota bacterium]|nr:MoaD/ThiS family protein [Acidobacteriota bacterium]